MSRGLRASIAALLLCAATIGASAQQARTPVTFNRDVAPLLFDHCAGCHRPGESAPFSLLTYDDARQRGRLMALAVSSHAMPPWQPDAAEGTFEGERGLDNGEIETLLRWVSDGMLEGDAAERPAAPLFTPGWQLGEPDLVLTMPEGFTVPADGPDVFRNFVLPIQLGDRRYVRALEFRPGNARVVHHVRMLLDDTGDIRRMDDEEEGPGFGGMDVPGARFPDGHFLGWAPGKRPTREAYPWPLEPGNDLVVQMHLKPSGRQETVRASVGLYFSDTPPIANPIMVRLGSKTIDIPAGAQAYEVVDRFTLPVDVDALSIYPHAHYLATSMQVDARMPGGRLTTLLRIPSWNFNWQDEYAYARPVALPRGTTLEMRYRYDNSASNPRNPSSPPLRVRFGSDTRDEMGELLVQVLPRRAADAAPLRAEIARRNLLADIAGEEKRVADVPDDARTRNALGVAYIQAGRVNEALAQFEASLRIRPDLAMAHYNLGVIAMNQQRPDEAIERFASAIALESAYAEAHNNLGIVLESRGRARDAEVHYRAAIAAKPASAAAHNNLGRTLLARGAVADALSQFTMALRSRPDEPDVLYNLGRALVANRQPREAVQAWRRAVAARPDSAVFALDLAWLLATEEQVSDPGEAVRLAERASRAGGNADPAALDVLGAAYAADGRLDLAVRTAQSALQRALAVNNTPLARDIRVRLQQYEAALPGSAASPDRP